MKLGWDVICCEQKFYKISKNKKSYFFFALLLKEVFEWNSRLKEVCIAV